ncbi:MAG: oligosaccharide flippase family protein [Rhodospirillales bacterium]|nr:oligosaccharide flippase family protein [Rhodospirillales bacterium]
MSRLRRLLDRALGNDQRLSTLFRGSALVMATQIAGIGLAYAMQVIVARWAGAFEFGIFAYAWTWMNLIFLVAAFGLNESALRMLPTYAAHSEWSKMRALVVRGPMLVLTLGSMAGATAVVGLALLGNHVGEHYRVPLMLTFAAAPFFGLLAFFQGVGRALGGVFAAFLPRYIGLPALVLLAVGAIVVYGRTPDAALLVMVTVSAAAVLAIVQGVTLIRELPAEARRVRSISPVGDWMRLSMPFLFIAVCFGLLTHCDLLMVGFFLSATDVAIYQAASRTAALVSFPLFALNALVAPMIARLHAEKRLEDLQRTVTMATQVVFWPCLVGAVIAILGGRYILGIFGTTFESGHMVMSILVLGHLINVGTGPVSYLMTMTGNQDRCAVVWASTVVGQFAINLLLIPHLGLIGAAIGTTLATSFLCVSLTILVRQKLNIRAHAFVPVCQTFARAIRP